MNRNTFLTAGEALCLRECEQSFCRTGGNGGQKVNKTSVAVRLTHPATGLSVNDGSSRSQKENRHHALKKLRFAMAFALREAPEEGFQLEPVPSLNHEHYVLFLAKLLDHLAFHGWELPETAEELGTTRSKLLRTLARDGTLFQEFNRQRAILNLHPLKGN